MFAGGPINNPSEDNVTAEQIIETVLDEETVIARTALERPLSANEFDANNIYFSFLLNRLNDTLTGEGGVVKFPISYIDILPSDIAASLSGNDENSDGSYEGDGPDGEGGIVLTNPDTQKFLFNFNHGIISWNQSTPEKRKTIAINAEMATGLHLEGGNYDETFNIVYGIGRNYTVNNDKVAAGVTVIDYYEKPESFGNYEVSGVCIVNMKETPNENGNLIINNSVYLGKGINSLKQGLFVKNSMITNYKSDLMPDSVTDSVGVFNEEAGIIESILASENINTTNSETGIEFSAPLTFIKDKTYNLIEVKVIGIDGNSGAAYTAIKNFTVKLDGTNTEIVAGTTNVVESTDNTSGMDISLVSFEDDSNEIGYQVKIEVPQGLNMHLTVVAKVTTMVGYAISGSTGSGDGSGSGDGGAV